MLGLLTDASIVISFIESYLPDLHKHLVDVGFELHLNNLLYKWFLALFIQNIPYEVLKYKKFKLVISDYLGYFIPRRDNYFIQSSAWNTESNEKRLDANRQCGRTQ